MTTPSCDNCGACCMEMESPPGYAMCSPPAGYDLLDGVAETDDYKRWLTMPADLRDELAAYYTRLRDNPLMAMSRDSEPCIWLGDDRRCKHYEWRPDVCREFNLGCDGCLSWRDQYNITPWMET